MDLLESERCLPAEGPAEPFTRIRKESGWYRGILISSLRLSEAASGFFVNKGEKYEEYLSERHNHVDAGKERRV